jgi:hypothetical protein
MSGKESPTFRSDFSDPIFGAGMIAIPIKKMATKPIKPI